MLRPVRSVTLLLGLVASGCFSASEGGAGVDGLVGGDGGGDGDGGGNPGDASAGGCADDEFCALVDPFDAPLSAQWVSDGKNAGCTFATEGGALVVTGAAICKLSTARSYAITAGGLRFSIQAAPEETLDHYEVGIEDADDVAGTFAGFVVRPNTLGADVIVTPGTYDGDPAPTTTPTPPYDLVLRVAGGNLIFEVDVGGEVSEQRRVTRPAFGDEATAYVYLVGEGGSAARLEVSGVNAPP